MKLEVFDDADSVAQAAAGTIAADARAAVAARGRFTLAVSGGHTPWIMLRAWRMKMSPGRLCIFTRWTSALRPREIRIEISRTSRKPAAACSASPRSMSTPCRWSLPIWSPRPRSMRVVLQQTVGSPPVLDLVHLGLGPDGHTASLVPGDPVLKITDADVAVTGVYQGRRRMTLTYPALNRARRVLWVVTGGEKMEMLASSAGR